MASIGLLLYRNMKHIPQVNNRKVGAGKVPNLSLHSPAPEPPEVVAHTWLTFGNFEVSDRPGGWVCGRSSADDKTTVTTRIRRKEDLTQHPGPAPKGIHELRRIMMIGM